MLFFSIIMIILLIMECYNSRTISCCNEFFINTVLITTKQSIFTIIVLTFLQ